ncbi:Hypothetical predicted protein, partial [Podarcis lilfordi]
GLFIPSGKMQPTHTGKVCKARGANLPYLHLVEQGCWKLLASTGPDTSSIKEPLHCLAVFQA